MQTPDGLAWMELDTGGYLAMVVGNHIAPLVGMKPDVKATFDGSLTLANGIPVSGTAQTGNLIMDGNIGYGFLQHWIMTMDLEHGRVWLAPLPEAKDPHAQAH